MSDSDSTSSSGSESVQPTRLSSPSSPMTKPKEPSRRLSGDDQVTPTSPAEGQAKKEPKCPKETFDPIPMLDAVCTYISFAVVFMFGHLAELLRKLGIRNDGAEYNPTKDVRLWGFLLKLCICSWHCYTVQYTEYRH